MVIVPHSRAPSFATPRALRRPPILLCVLIISGVVSPPTGNRTSMASSGAWMGSGASDSDIRKLCRGQFLGLTEEVGARAPSPDEISPSPKEGEFVVFSAHLEQ